MTIEILYLTHQLQRWINRRVATYNVNLKLG